jgi:hypothetical protein
MLTCNSAPICSSYVHNSWHKSNDFLDDLELTSFMVNLEQVNRYS